MEATPTITNLPDFDARPYNGLAGGDFEGFSGWVDMGLGKASRLPMTTAGGTVLLRNSEPVCVMFSHPAPAGAGIMFLEGIYAPAGEWLASGPHFIESALRFCVMEARELDITEIRAWIPGASLDYMQRCGFVLDCPMASREAQTLSGAVPVRASVSYFTNLFGRPWRREKRSS